LFLEVTCEISGHVDLNKLVEFTQPCTNRNRTYVLCHSPSLQSCEGRPLEPGI